MLCTYHEFHFIKLFQFLQSINLLTTQNKTTRKCILSYNNYYIIHNSEEHLNGSIIHSQQHCSE